MNHSPYNVAIDWYADSPVHTHLLQTISSLFVLHDADRCDVGLHNSFKLPLLLSYTLCHYGPNPFLLVFIFENGIDASCPKWFHHPTRGYDG